jgi:hypothetical protein
MRGQLKLTEDSYRAMVTGASNGRVESSAKMTAEERGRLLDRLRGMGAGKKVNARRRPPAGAERQLGLLRALWLSLYNLDEVRDPRDAALAAWACRQLEIDAIARRVTLISMQWHRLREAGALRLPADADADALAAWADRNQRIAGGVRRAGLDLYAANDLDRIIRDLGRWLRTARGVAAGGGDV